MRKGVDKVDIEDTADTGVEDSVPVIAFALEVRWKSVHREVNKLVSTSTQVAVVLLLLLMLWQGHGLLLLSDGGWWCWSRDGG